MYQGGYGVRRNLQKARDMYRKAIEFGSANARSNLEQINTTGAGIKRKTLVKPDYR